MNSSYLKDGESRCDKFPRIHPFLTNEIQVASFLVMSSLNPLGYNSDTHWGSEILRKPVKILISWIEPHFLPVSAASSASSSTNSSGRR